MRLFSALILTVGGIIFALWIGVWWAFIGGIVDVIVAVRAPDLVPFNIAVGIAKVALAAPVFWLTAGAFSFAAYAIRGRK